MRKDVIAEYQGPCVACLLANCERFSARCETTQGGLAQCICPSVQNCPVVPDTVCANDSRVYTTECHMNVQACQLRRALSVVKRGTCRTCQDLRCEYYAKCVENGGQPTCQCPTLGECSGRNKPVCGSDDVVYQSECHMKVASCQAKASITVRNKGVCDRDVAAGFKGNSFMRYAALSQMKIEGEIQMDIKPISRSGILLSNKGKGRRFDFIFLVLRRGWVIFGYDLGKGSAIIKSNVRIKINEWNNIRAYRKGINGYLEVNGKRVVGASPSGLSQLNLDDYMYLGGVQSVSAKYAKILKTKAGFFGSVANLVISGVRYGLVFPGWFTLAAVNVVMNSNKDLCMMKPCYYGGTCRVIENEVKCICPRGFLGDRCEIRANVPYFQGGAIGSASYIQLEPMVLRTDEFAVVLEVRPEHHTGLIMYSELNGDFISLAMLAGKLELRFNLGQGSVIISSDSLLGLNQWHHVEIIRVGKEGMLIVDYGKAQTGTAPREWTSLNLASANVYLGGGVSRNRARILRDTGVEVGFQGCIRELETEDEDLRERPLDLMISDGNNRASSRVFHRVKKCGCVDHGCQNEGTCMQRDHDFRCECKNGYTGYQCHIKGCSKDFVFDVGFAIDGSGSIDNNEYRLTKDFVLDIIGIFSVSDEGTHVALLEYASEAPIKIYFDDNYELLNEVKGLKQSKGHTTNIGTGLKRSLVMFDVNHGMRQEVEKLFVFFTDGINTDRDEDLTQYTRQIKSKGITTISVGVGNDTDINELTTIAGSRENVIKLGEFEELKLIVEKLIPKECKDGE